MNEIEQINFSTHARLKDIIGRGLIYNDNIALIELIKNSKDAMSSMVELEFLNSNSVGTNSKILIRDYGKGMSLEDIKNKWLNMAYSSKKNNLKEDGKNYAGNKGIGRFSCDRLGKKLDLYTFQGEECFYFHINWETFEVDDPDLTIQDNKFSIYRIEKSEILKYFKNKNFQSGTMLIISDLRDCWPFEKLMKLKKELEKFTLSPLDKSSTGDFDVYIQTNYLENPQKQEIEGLVVNKVFEELNFRTTSIEASIDSKGKVLTTILKHDGNFIFKIKEKNPYSKLKNITSKIYYLNTASKGFFTKKTGYKHLDYGSIFMFLNGFRVFPYGESGNDWLDIDRRKAQGYNRYLGTRDLIGYISIEDNESFFIPVSAREGVVKNEAFEQLQSPYEIKEIGKPGFISKAFRRLEKFVVEGLDWDTVCNYSSNSKFDIIDPSSIEYSNNDENILLVLSSVIYQGINKNEILDIEINKDYLKHLAEKEQNAFENFANQLEIKLEKEADLIPNKKYILNFLSEQNKKLKQKEELTNTLIEENIELNDIIEQKETIIQEQKEQLQDQQKTIEEIETENLFHKSNASQDAKALRNLIHKIVIDTNGIKSKISAYRYKKDNNVLNNENIEEYFRTIAYLTDSILKVADLAKSRNYNMKTGYTTVELSSFIKNYLSLLNETRVFSEIQIIDKISEDIKINKKIKPLELFIIIDNIINNSIKAYAKEISFCIIQKSEFFVLIITDNGNGLNKNAERNKLFERGYTTTSGAGLGLSHVKEIIEKLNWEVKLQDNLNDGFGLEVYIK